MPSQKEIDRGTKLTSRGTKNCRWLIKFKGQTMRMVSEGDTAFDAVRLCGKLLSDVESMEEYHGPV